MVSVDARGQMVLPKEVREKAGIAAGDKLVLATWQGDGSACCIFLMKADMLSSMLGTVLGPFMKALGSEPS
jgi:AbrB family looped-hinge helix DNA binding protein